MRIFREIKIEDIPALFRVRTATDENRLSMEELAALEINPTTVKAKLLADHKGWLCEDAGTAVGFAMGDRVTGELWVIAVLPSHIGQGIGSELLTRVENWLFDAGCTELWLVTAIDPQRRAYAFYLKRGWQDWKVEAEARYLRKVRNGAGIVSSTTVGKGTRDKSLCRFEGVV